MCNLFFSLFRISLCVVQEIQTADILLQHFCIIGFNIIRMLRAAITVTITCIKSFLISQQQTANIGVWHQTIQRYLTESAPDFISHLETLSCWFFHIQELCRLYSHLICSESDTRDLKIRNQKINKFHQIFVVLSTEILFHPAVTIPLNILSSA